MLTLQALPREHLQHNTLFGFLNNRVYFCFFLVATMKEKKKMDVSLEVEKPPFETLLGPGSLYVGKCQGFTVWVFGERHGYMHDFEALYPLDAEPDNEDGVLFTGSTKSGLMEMRRFLYHAAEAALRKQQRLDIMVELKRERGYYKGPVAYPARLAGIQRLFMHCFKGNYTRCQFSPFVHFHEVDYRDPSKERITASITNVMIEFEYAAEALTAEGHGYSARLVRRIAQALVVALGGVSWQRMALDLELKSNKYAAKYIAWAVDPCVQAVAELNALIREWPVLETHLITLLVTLASVKANNFHAQSVVRGNRNVSKTRAQYLALRAESPALARAIMQHFSGLYRESSQVSMALLENEAIIMDVAVMCRLFRTFGSGAHATVKIVYVGHAHAQRYVDFLERILSCPALIKFAQSPTDDDDGELPNAITVTENAAVAQMFFNLIRL